MTSIQIPADASKTPSPVAADLPPANVKRLAGNIYRGGRGYEFVVHHPQFFPLPGKLEHQFHKIRAAFGTTWVLAIDGGNPHHEMPRDDGAHKKLPCELGISVDVERCGLVLFRIGLALKAIEYVVGTDVD
jgi:hypothetical protein